MWKNWFPFRKKEENKRTISSIRSSENQMSGKDSLISKENHKTNGTGRKRAVPNRVREIEGNDRLIRFNSSKARSPFTRRIIFTENDDSSSYSVGNSHSVMNPSGPLLATPLLPKIRRAIQMNDNLNLSHCQTQRGYRHSPLTRNQEAQSYSLNYGPTHPTKSTPGQLPLVRLNRQPSLRLLSGRCVKSPSTVKVAPPSSTLLSTSSFRTSPVPSMSPVKTPMVDTQTVVSALRERSCRKRSTVAAAEDSILEEEYSQMAKRRRQDSSISMTSSASIPPLPIELSMSKHQDGISALQHIEQIATKRSPAPRKGSLAEAVVESQPIPKRERQQHNNRILSSLSSFRRDSEQKEHKTSAVLTKDQPIQRAKRTQSECLSTGHKESIQPAKKIYPELPTTIGTNNNNRVLASPLTINRISDIQNTNQNGTTSGTPRAQETQVSTPRKKTILNVLEQSNRHRSDTHPSLARPVTKPTMIASPADLECDRNAEDARRVRDVLAYLDEDEEDSSAGTISKSSTAVTFISSTVTSVPTTSTTVESTTSTIPFGQLPTTALITSSSISTSHISSAALTKPAVTSVVTSASLNTGPGLANSVTGLVQSSGASATSGLVSNKPICATGGEGLFANLMPNSAADLVSASSSSVSCPAATVTSSSGKASLPSSVSASLLPPNTCSASLVASQSGTANTSEVSPSLYTFKPVFGVQASSPDRSYPSDSRSETSGKDFFSENSNSSTTQQQNLMTAANTKSGGFSLRSVMTPSSGSSSSANAFNFKDGSASVPSTTAASGGFSFGTSLTSTTSSGAFVPQVSADFSFGTLASKPGDTNFSFGGTNPDATNTSGISFGQSTSLVPNQTAQQNTFGQNTKLTSLLGSADDTGKNFQPKSLFGVPVSDSGMGATSLTSSGVFKETSAPSTQSVLFGQTVPSKTTANGEFSFGSNSVTSGGSNFAFGQVPSVSSGFGAAVTTSSESFSFGSTPASGNTGLFTFGPKPSVPGNTNTLTFTQPPTTAPSNTFTFGKSSVSTAPSGPMPFGTPKISATTPGFGFTFASATATTAGNTFPFGAGGTSDSTSIFGSAKPPQTSQQTPFAGAAGAGTGFSFGVNQSQQPAHSSGFGTQPQQASTFGSQPQQPSTFGSQPQQPSTFGSQPQQPSTFGSQPRQPSTFGSQPQQPSAFASQPQQASTFGTQPQQASAFGTQPQQPSAFGSQPQQASTFGTQPQQASTFGTQPQQPSAFGSQPQQASTFGTQPQQASTFGTQPQQPSAFGSQPQQASTFGTQPQQASTFGTQSKQPSAFGTQPQQASTFGSQPQQPSTFGSFGNSAGGSSGFNFGGPAAGNNLTPVFGSSATQEPPVFGSASKTPVFGTSHSNSSTPVFGASANQNSSATNSISANAFTFGAANLAQPNSTSGGFQFGQPGVSGGGGRFDFSASLSGAPQFNFTAGGGAATAGNMFTPGAGSTAPKPRVAATRPRRRGNIRK